MFKSITTLTYQDPSGIKIATLKIGKLGKRDCFVCFPMGDTPLIANLSFFQGNRPLKAVAVLSLESRPVQSTQYSLWICIQLIRGTVI